MNLHLFSSIDRAMAICIALMFGRLGSVFGANAGALLLDNHCEVAFYLFGSTVIGEKHRLYIFNSTECRIYLNYYFSFSIY